MSLNLKFSDFKTTRVTGDSPRIKIVTEIHSLF